MGDVHLNAIAHFAGWGGACLGILWATGMSPYLAVNHDEHAIRSHQANHENVDHRREDVWNVDPIESTGGRPPWLMWTSPDCKHFSRAKGSALKDKKIRGLAWVTLRWAARAQPSVICLENVPEFTTWGPLNRRGRVIKSKAGSTFRRFVHQLRSIGYTVEWRTLSACDYGTPTTRERLYLVARRDGFPVAWPKPTHGPGRPQPWRTAAECIDWSIPALSIFATADEAKAWAKERNIGAIKVDRVGIPQRPLADATCRRIAAGIVRYVVNSASPFLVNLSHGGRVEGLDSPMRTVTATPKGGDRVLVTATLAKLQGTNVDGADIRAPLGTVTAGGLKHGVVTAEMHRASAWIAKHYTGVVGSDVRAPLGTVTSVDHHSIVVADLARLEGIDEQTLGKARRVAAFIVKYYGSGGQHQKVTDPLHTIPCVARFGLVLVEMDGDTWAITDIRMRMLEPRELARAQGFPDTYKLLGTKAQQIARIGNSVCPQVAEAIVRAQVEVTDPRVAQIAMHFPTRMAA